VTTPATGQPEADFASELAPAVGAHLDDLVRRHPALEPRRDDLAAAFTLLDRCVRGDRRIYTCGNGGSAADSEHIAAELMKGFEHARPLAPHERVPLEAAGLDAALIDKLQAPIAVIPLTGFAALRTAIANDCEPTLEFAQLTLALVCPDDVLIAISTSGNSANVVHAARVAKARGAAVIALTGQRDSTLSEVADITLRSPTTRTLEVQEFHLPMYHTLALMLEASVFG
jgi:D-sedoheptulose 7-phosphate isomerase